MTHQTTIGILGAGQLGRMLGLAGIPLGLTFRFFDPVPASPAACVGSQTVAEYGNEQALEQFAKSVTLATYEFENIPKATAAYLAERIPVYPGVRALETAQDRLTEKSLFQKLSIPTPQFLAIDSAEDLALAIHNGFPLPAVLKTRRMGYDGKGQHRLKQGDDPGTVWKSLGGVPLILEEFISFDGEVSLIGVRSTTGEEAFYPLVQNVHHDGILATSSVPGSLPDGQLQEKAEGALRQLMQHLDYTGVCTIEFFVCSGELVANEIAPRVHNSGHWTIEGATTSQFENHLRAILGLPLGSTRACGKVEMTNIISELPDLVSILAESGAHLHIYGKEPRAGRKLGHITRIS